MFYLKTEMKMALDELKQLALKLYKKSTCLFRDFSTGR